MSVCGSCPQKRARIIQGFPMASFAGSTTRHFTPSFSNSYPWCPWKLNRLASCISSDVCSFVGEAVVFTARYSYIFWAMTPAPIEEGCSLSGSITESHWSPKRLNRLIISSWFFQANSSTVGRTSFSISCALISEPSGRKQRIGVRRIIRGCDFRFRYVSINVW